MFIIVPLIFIVGSLVGMAIIVRRKLPYLRKLSPESHEFGEHIFSDFFPELVGWFKGIKWHEYNQISLRETEKLLRRLRLVVLKVDHVSERLIRKVRRTHITAHLEQVATEAEKPVEPLVPDHTVVLPLQPTHEELKAREQQLIIEISQDPKNSGLYETLGDLYLKMSSIPDAKEAYEAALGFNPDNLVIARKYSALLKKTDIS